jgi:hypothetical protein
MRFNGLMTAGALSVAAMLAASAPAQNSTGNAPQSQGDQAGQNQPGPGGPTQDVTIVSGTVEAYEPGQSITITQQDGTKTTYTVNQKSQMPPKLATGKTVTVRTTKSAGSPVVQRVTYTTTSTTTTKKSP